MSLRIALNLAVFAALGLVLGYWALTDVLQVDLRNPPYTVTADFEDSPGLQPDYDVAYLGTPIGRIRAVDLVDDRVRVRLAIEADREVPVGSSLAVRRKSAVGEPYVDVIPPAGAERDGPVLEDGDHVPLDRTVTPLSYSELFSALHDLVATVPEDDLGTLLSELAAGLDGRAGSLRDLFTGGEDAMATFAEGSELIEDVTESLSRLVGVLAEHRGSITDGLDHTEVVTDTLASARADLERVLADGSSLATRTADVLAEAKGDVDCIVAGLSTVSGRLGGDEVLAALESLLSTAPAAAAVFRDIIAWEEDGPYVRAVPPLNVGLGEPVPVYERPRQLPEVADVAPCGDLPATAEPAGAAPAGPGGAGQVDAGPSPANDPGPTAQVDDQQASSDREAGGGRFDLVPVLVALLAIASVAAVRPWRWRPGGS